MPHGLPAVPRFDPNENSVTSPAAVVIVRMSAVALPYPDVALFVTATGSLVPVVAVAETFMVAVIVFAQRTLTLVKLTPVGPIRLAPEAKPEPLTVTEVVVPRAALEGLMEALLLWWTAPVAARL
jgi:hypothetical protein